MTLDNITNPIAMRRDLHKCFRLLFQQYLPTDAVVYDVGCGQKPFAEFLKGKVSQHIGVDLADGFYKPDYVDLIGSAYEVPAPDGAADAVILSQVIEHLESPLLAIQEAQRLLKPGGLVFLSFPFLYPIHAPPRDYCRFTEFYLTSSIIGENFEVVDSIRLGGYWYLMGMFAHMYLQDANRGVVKATLVVKVVSWAMGMTCLVLHKIEGALLRLAGKNAEAIRAKWTANYLAVLRMKDSRVSS